MRPLYRQGTSRELISRCIKSVGNEHTEGTRPNLAPDCKNPAEPRKRRDGCDFFSIEALYNVRIPEFSRYFPAFPGISSWGRMGFSPSKPADRGNACVRNGIDLTMNLRKNRKLLFLALAACALSITAALFYPLYLNALEKAREHLKIAAKAQAAVIEAPSRTVKPADGNLSPMARKAWVLEPVTGFYRYSPGVGKSGMSMVGFRKGDRIEFLLGISANRQVTLKPRRWDFQNTLGSLVKPYLRIGRSRVDPLAQNRRRRQAFQPQQAPEGNVIPVRLTASKSLLPKANRAI